MKLLLSTTFLVLLSAQTFSAHYVGKSDNGKECYMKQNKEYKTATFLEKGKKSYMIFQRDSMEHVSTKVMSSNNGYREPIGSVITIFGLGVKKVTLNLVSKNKVPLSYHLEVSGPFNDIKCNDLKKI